MVNSIFTIKREAKTISKPYYRCEKYNKELKLITEYKGYKKFIDEDGRVHQCIKFKNGKQKICHKLIT